MNLLFVGSGNGGSWQIRGEQLGAALGARVVNVPSPADWKWADLVVLVKRAAFMFGHQARAAGVPIVWDALDFWRQPTDNPMSADQAIRLLLDRQAEIQPALTIGATEAMAKAAGGVYLPHHCWPGLTPAPARETVRVVGYQGNPQYLGGWRVRLEQACARRGLEFVVNPTDLTQADILVAFRDGAWDGWMCREWKSGVKVTNAIAAGRPIIGQPSAAFDELNPCGTAFERPEELDGWLDAWTPYDTRAAVVVNTQRQAPHTTVAALADRYRASLADVRTRCAA